MSSRGHGKSPGFKPGDHWVVCDVCGLEFRNSQMRKRWDNLVVCKADWELRHPQDFLKARKDRIAAQGFVRPQVEDQFATPVCTTRDATAGEALAGCAIAGFTTPSLPAGTF